MGTVKQRSFPFYGPNAITIRQVRPKSKEAQANLEYGQVGRQIDNLSAFWKSFSGIQVTESENHAGWEYGYTMDLLGNSELRNYHPDRGGDFTTQKIYVERPAVPVTQRISSGWYRPYDGAPYELLDTQECAIKVPFGGPLQWPPSGKSSETDLQKLGTTAIARCAPSNNVANLASALIELRNDGLPTMLGSTTWAARTQGLRGIHSSIGQEHLNFQFGVKPLISDIRDTMHGILNFNELYSQYAKNAGKRVRRRYGFPSTTKVTDTKILTNADPDKVANVDFSSWYQLPYSSGRGDVFLRRETTKRQWFSGAFTYHLPALDDGFLGYAERAVNLLGLDIDAEVLWNVTPWSWAVDWFGNVGDVIHNVGSWSEDGLVLVYGYIMEHSLVRDIYYWTGKTTYWKPSGLTFPEIFVLVNETKVRRRATPFGFGLTMSGLSTRQKAIAAALGLSRA